MHFNLYTKAKYFKMKHAASEHTFKKLVDELKQNFGQS